MLGNDTMNACLVLPLS